MDVHLSDLMIRIQTEIAVSHKKKGDKLRETNNVRGIRVVRVFLLEAWNISERKLRL